MNTLARPDLLGWDWCGWMDGWESSERFMQHAGLQDALGQWRQPQAGQFSKSGKTMYPTADRGG